MWDVAAPSTEGIENLGKLAVCKQAVEAHRSELENGLVTLDCLEPLFVGTVGNKPGFDEEGETVREAQ